MKAKLRKNEKTLYAPPTPIRTNLETLGVHGPQESESNQTLPVRGRKRDYRPSRRDTFPRPKAIGNRMGISLFFTRALVQTGAQWIGYSAERGQWRYF